MLVVEKKHHSKLYVDSLDQTDRKKAVSFLEESFPEAEIYEEVSDDEYTDDFAVAEARAAYATMKPSSMLKALTGTEYDSETVSRGGWHQHNRYFGHGK